MKIIASEDEYRIVRHQAGALPSERIIITFAGMPHSLEDKGFGTDYSLAQGWDNIYVSQLRGTQFQGLSLESFLEAVKPEIEGKEVICYGSSLGGYAAFYYGGALDARIIAAAPVFPVWLDRFNGKQINLEIKRHELADVPRSSKAPFVLYDPLRNLDKIFVDHAICPAYPHTLRAEKYPLGGHTVLETLKRTGQFSLITKLIETDEIEALQPLVEGEYEYHYQKGKLLKHQDAKVAVVELEKALALRPSNGVTVHLLPILVRLGDLARAQEIIDQATESCDPDQRIVGNFRTTMIEAGLHVIPEDEMKERIRAKRRAEHRAKVEAEREAADPRD